MYFSELKPVALIKIPGSVVNIGLIPNNAVEKLDNPLPVIGRDQNSIWLIQNAALGFKYVFVVKTKKFDDYTLLFISTATNKESEKPVQLANKQADEAMYKGFDLMLKDHENGGIISVQNPLYLSPIQRFSNITT